MIYNNKLISDMSFFNEYKVYRNLQAIQMYSQKVLLIKCEDKGTRDFSEWWFFLVSIFVKSFIKAAFCGTVEKSTEYGNDWVGNCYTKILSEISKDFRGKISI